LINTTVTGALTTALASYFEIIESKWNKLEDEVIDIV
jgi:hypothetical protein